MADGNDERPSRWQAYLSGLRRWFFRRRKVLLAVIWVAKFIWRVCKLILGDDPWTFYSFLKGACLCNTRHSDWCGSFTT
jgi:hypothetical protein